MRQAVIGQQFQIEDGPSKFDLMSSLFVGSASKGDKRTVTFTLRAFGEIVISIEGIMREDGSGESWIFMGYVRNADDGPNKVRGYFTTRRRIGHVTFVENFWRQS